MLGLPPTTPFALTRHLLDYPIHDSASDYAQLPLPAPKTRSSPPPRPPRPDPACLECLSPTPTRATTRSWMTTLDQAAELDSQRRSKRDEEPSTPKARPRSNSQARTHPFSPVTPSRLSLPPVTADNTDDFSPVTNMDSPYYPIYVLPRRKTPELTELARKKDNELYKHSGPRPPKIRSRHSISGDKPPVARESKRDVYTTREPDSLENAIRQLVDSYPNVAQKIPKSAPSPVPRPQKTKAKSFSFSAFADKYNTRSAVPGRAPDRTPSPPQRVTSSRRHPRSPSSPGSPNDSTPSTPSRTPQRSPSPSPSRTSRHREPINYDCLLTDKRLLTPSPKSHAMQRDSTERRIPKTTLVPDTSSFYGSTETPKRKPSTKTRPIAIPMPSPQMYLGVETRSDNSYPPIQISSGLTSPIGNLWKPYSFNKDRKERDRVIKSKNDEVDSMDIDDMVVISTRDDGSDDEEMGDVSGVRAPNPESRFYVTLDGIDEGMWLSGTPAKENHDDEIDMFAESFREVESPKPEELELPLAMPSTPRLKNLAPPALSKRNSKCENSVDPDTIPAFLTPFAQRGEIATHPYHRSAEFVLAETRKREASIVRPPPGTVRVRRRRAPKEVENLCVFTLQKNFSKAVQQSESPQPKVVTPPVEDASPPADAWWGGRVSPPGKQSPLDNYSQIRHIEVADDDEDEEMEDRSMWASQTHGLGLGLGLGFNLELPLMTRTTSSRPVPRPRPGVDPNSPSPPLSQRPSGTGLPRSLSAGDLSALSPALPLGDGTKEGSMTPSPTTPEIVTPEFENESGERKVMVKEKYREGPGRSIAPMFGHSWGRNPSDDDDDDDDMPLMPRPTKKDKGKGKAPAVDDTQDDSESMPSLTPDVGSGGSDEVDYQALADAFGIDDVEEVMMQYALERSRQETTMKSRKESCGDSPGASTSRSPPSQAFDTDIEMEDATTNTDSTGSHEMFRPDAGLEDEAAWFNGWTFPTTRSNGNSLSAEIQRSLSTPLNLPDDQDQAEDEIEKPVDAGVDKEASNLMGALQIQESLYDLSTSTNPSVPMNRAHDNDSHDGSHDHDDNHDHDDEPSSADSDDQSDDHRSSNDITTPKSLLTPNITLTPASPCSHNSGSPSPVHIRQITASQLGVPRVRNRVPTSSPATETPSFFRPPRPYQNQSGNSGVHFANRMYTKWKSLTARAHAEKRGSGGTGESKRENGQRRSDRPRCGGSRRIRFNDLLRKLLLHFGIL